jgi:preprotein translocase subunit SecG
MIGVKQTTDLLEKITWGLLSTIFILTLSSNFFISRPTLDDVLNSPNVEKAQQNRNALPANPKPQEPTKSNDKPVENKDKKQEAKPTDKQPEKK